MNFCVRYGMVLAHVSLRIVSVESEGIFGFFACSEGVFCTLFGHSLACLVQTCTPLPGRADISI
jgi:hypothetical protein